MTNAERRELRRIPLYRCVLLAGALVLTGCGGGVATAVWPPTTSAPPSRLTPAPASTTTSAAQPATTSAADGNNVAACATGNCEVQTGLGPIVLIPQLASPPLTIDMVLVQQIQDGSIMLGIAPVSLDQFHFACSGGDPSCAVIQPGGIANAGTATGGPGTVITANELTIRIEAVEANTTIIRLSTS